MESTKIKIDYSIKIDKIKKGLFIFKVDEYKLAGQGKTKKECRIKAARLVHALVKYGIGETMKPVGVSCSKCDVNKDS